MSRVTNIDRMYITTPDDNPQEFIFYHGRRIDTSNVDLIGEYQRLSLNMLETKYSTIKNLMLQKDVLCVITFSQSLRAHFQRFS